MKAIDQEYIVFQIQSSALESLVQGNCIEEVLDNITSGYENQFEGSKCSVLIFNPEKNTLHNCSAPSLPEKFRKKIEGISIGPQAGSCGTAVYRKSRVIVEDIETDPLWEKGKNLALRNGLRSCWSVPILNFQQDVLGTFAVYYEKPGKPDLSELEFIESMVRIAGVIIEKRQNETKLAESEARFKAVMTQGVDAIFIHDDSGKLIDCNKRAWKSLGYTREELLELLVMDIEKNIEAKSFEEFLSSIENDSIAIVDGMHQRKDGSRFPVEVHVGRIHIGGEEYFLATVRDISKRKQEEEEINNHRLQLEKMVEERTREVKEIANLAEENREPVFRVNYESILLYANSAAAEILKSFGCSDGDKIPNVFAETVNHVITGKKSDSMELELEQRIYKFEIVNISDQSYCNIYGRDITQQKLAERSMVVAKMEAEKGKKLAELEQQKLFKILDNLPIMFHLQAQDYSIPYANKKFKEQFGEPEKACYQVMHDRASPCEVCTTFKVFDHGRDESSVWVTPEGKTFLTVCTPFTGIDGISMVMEMALDITEQEEAKKEAEKASKAKSEFLSRMSHELRTPMNAIMGFAQILEMDLDNPLNEIQREHLGRITYAANHLLGLINDVLDLSKIETGNIELAVEKVDMVPIVDNVVLLSKSLADEKGISIEYLNIPETSCYVEIDPLRFKQVVLNLMSNAIKYNKPNGSVILSYAKSMNNSVRLGIRDTGRGISEEERDKLFKPFERFDEDAEYIEGTGIGLTITKQLIGLMGGSIGYESVVGEGSYFYVDVPVADRKPLIQMEEKEDAVQSSLVNNDLKKILYFEDNSTNVELVRQIFRQREDMRFLSASTVGAGIELAKSETPDLILMDINMPDMDGLTAFKKLQTLNETRGIPVIALSADAMDVDIRKALNIGFKDYITKPIDVPELINKIDEVFV